MTTKNILISEVGPRDGLQNVASIMATEDKKIWIKLAAEAGIREIEVGSFVSSRLLPQLADTPEVVDYAASIPGLTVAALIPNLKGAENALKTAVHKLTIPLSVSETHSMKNVRKNHADMLTEIKAIAELLDTLQQDKRPHFEGSLSTAFGCTIEGNVLENKVVELAVKLMEAGCDEVGLSDTSGYANPEQIKRLIRKVRQAIGDDKLTGIHLHNTRGLGLANALAALEEDMTTIDSSLGGLGGCPFAPGASGNIVTEDLAFMLEAMGYHTGIDLHKLLELRKQVEMALPEETFYGFTIDAGLPKGFKEAVNQAVAVQYRE